MTTEKNGNRKPKLWIASIFCHVHPAQAPDLVIDYTGPALYTAQDEDSG